MPIDSWISTLKPVLIAAICSIFACSPAKTGKVGSPAGLLSPANWPAGELQKFMELDKRDFPDNPAAVGIHGAVTNTYYAVAARAGLEALQKGGTSVDAALTTALTQVALNAGSVVSYFGILNMVHYDAATGEITSLDATWNTVRGETDPMSIPGKAEAGAVEELLTGGIPSGRTALVGGFLKGVEAAHVRYGKLPFAALFEPAVYLAENGFELSPANAAYFRLRDESIRRLPETRATLVKPDGSGYQPGDVFRQPALAATLRHIAKEGVDYMYKGPWAQKAVATIQSEGGKMTMEDLDDYQVIWSEPRRAQYGNYELAVLGEPCKGSINLIEGLNLAYAAGIPELGHWSKNGESLRRISDATGAYTLSFVNDAVKKLIYPGIDLSDSSRLTKETAALLWEQIHLGKALVQYASQGPKHSDTVVAVDRWGNMTAITHSINCVIWGATAIVVDGISIGDPASFQQAQIAAAGPGNRLPGPIEIGILLRNGQPVLPFASMATGLHQQTVQSLLNIIAFDMDIQDAVDAPSIFLPLTEVKGMAAFNTVRVMKGAFPEEVLESSRLPILQIEAKDRRYAQGLWVGIYRDPATGQLKAVSPPYASGRALAY